MNPLEDPGGGEAEFVKGPPAVGVFKVGSTGCEVGWLCDWKVP